MIAEFYTALIRLQREFYRKE